jgi:hypothetical protein
MEQQPASLVHMFGARRVDGSAADAALLGHKGAHLMEMCRLGLPVPPGFVLSTPVCDELRRQNRIYACQCSRKTLSSVAESGPQGIIYPGICAARNLPETGNALRLRVPDENRCFDDLCAGRVCENLTRTTGDFVVKRRDGVHSYHLATVVDDADAGVDQVVRGADLLDSTARQRWLQQLLGLPHPQYAHIPVIVNAAGQKLSKQNHARELDENRPVAQLLDAWRLLGQPPLPDEPANPKEFWTLARPRFRLTLAASHQQRYD